MRLRATLLAALLPALAFVLAGAARSQAAIDPAGLVAYVDPDGRLAVVDPVTAEVRWSASGGVARAQFPAWSSDGNALAAIVSDLGGGRVDLVDVAGGGAVVTAYRRADRAPIYLGWAPGDRTLAVLASAADGGLVVDLVDVPRVWAGERDAVRTFARGAPFYWSWSRTGRALWVHVDVLGPGRTVAVSGIDAYAPRATLPNPGAFQSPALSDDERYLAYATIDAGARRVAVVPNPDRPDLIGDAVARTLPHRGQAALAWRPGRPQLAVQSAAVPGPHAYGPVNLLDVPSGRVTRLTDDVVVASWWSPDGRWLATLSPVGGAGPRTVQAGSPAAVPGAARRGAHGATLAVASPEVAVPVQSGPALLSLKVIEVDGGTVRVLAAIEPTPLFVAQYLPFFDQYARSHRLWSPASDALVLPVLDADGVPTIARFGLDGGAVALAAGDMPAWNVR